MSPFLNLAPHMTALSASLSAILATARTRFTGAKSNIFVDIARFFAISLPAAFYRIRWLTMAILFFVPNSCTQL